MANQFEQIWQNFLYRLEEEIERSSQADVARRLGVNRGQISKWLSGLQVGGNLKTFVTHVNKLGIPLESLLLQGSAAQPELPDSSEIHTLEGNTPARPAYILGGNNHPEDAKGVIVPVYSMAGAGPAMKFEESEPIANISIPLEYARAALYPVKVVGNSMEPTLKEGGYVGIDRSELRLVQGKVYGVCLPYEGIVLKRVFLDHQKNSLILRSDNPDHPPITLPIEDREGLIIGRVIWVMQDV